MLLADRELSERALQIETLLGEIESIPDPQARTSVTAIVQGLVALYGEGLARILAIVTQQGEPHATRILDGCAGDELIAHLLLLHDLHPIPLETRVARALEEVRPYLHSHGGNVDLLGIRDGVALLRLQGSCSGCPSSTLTLTLAIEAAVRKAAPELLGIEAEGAVEPPPPHFVPIATLGRRERRPAPEAAWSVLGAPPQIAEDRPAVLEVDGRSVLVCRLEDTYYAYRDACPGCAHSLAAATLEGTDLRCPRCRHCFDVRRAGRCADAPDLFLEPIPLLVHDGLIKLKLSA